MLKLPKSIVLMQKALVILTSVSPVLVSGSCDLIPLAPMDFLLNIIRKYISGYMHMPMSLIGLVIVA